MNLPHGAWFVPSETGVLVSTLWEKMGVFVLNLLLLIVQVCGGRELCFYQLFFLLYKCCLAVDYYRMVQIRKERLFLF